MFPKMILGLWGWRCKNTV